MNQKFRLSGFIIFIALSISLVVGFTMNLYSFVQSFTQEEGASRDHQSKYRLHFLLEAKDFQLESENQLEVFNQKDNKTYTLQMQQPASFATAVADIPLSTTLIQVFISLTVIILYLMAFVCFFKFIFAVNRGKLFEKRNLRLLNRLGFCLISTFFLEVLFYLTDYQLLTSLFDFKDYTIPFRASFSFIQLISGLSALMVSQILSIGKQMKEDQELTI